MICRLLALSWQLKSVGLTFKALDFITAFYYCELKLSKLETVESRLTSEEEKSINLNLETKWMDDKYSVFGWGIL